MRVRYGVTKKIGPRSDTIYGTIEVDVQDWDSQESHKTIWDEINKKHPEHSVMGYARINEDNEEKINRYEVYVNEVLACIVPAASEVKALEFAKKNSESFAVLATNQLTLGLKVKISVKLRRE